MLDSLNVQANKLILRDGEVLNKAETEAKIDEVAYVDPENFVTGTGTANVSAKYVVIDPQHFTPGKLRSVSMHARAGTETKQVYLSIMEKPESVTEPNPHNWNPATWTHLGTSTNKVDEVGGRDSVWLFDGVILSNKPIACCEVYDPANTWDVDESRMGLWAFARPSSDTVSHIVGSLTVDMLPQATLVVSETVAGKVDEHISDTVKHLAAGEHDKLTPILASVTKNGSTIEVDSSITMKNGKNLNHGGGASTFVSGDDEFNMSVRGFYGGTKVGGTLEKSVELTIDNSNTASLKLNKAEVRTKKVEVLMPAVSPGISGWDAQGYLLDGGEYKTPELTNEMDISFSGLSFSGSEGYTTARIAVVVRGEGILPGSREWLTDSTNNPATYWLNQSEPLVPPTMDAVSDTPTGYDGTVYHVAIEKFGSHITANLAYQRPYKRGEI